MEWRDEEAGVRWLFGRLGLTEPSAAQTAWAERQEEEAFRQSRGRRADYARHLGKVALAVREKGASASRDGWEPVFAALFDSLRPRVNDDTQRRLDALRLRLTTLDADLYAICAGIISPIQEEHPLLLPEVEESLDQLMRRAGKCCSVEKRRLPSSSVYCDADATAIHPGDAFLSLKRNSAAGLTLSAAAVLCSACHRAGRLGAGDASRDDYEEKTRPRDGALEETVECRLCQRRRHKACARFPASAPSENFVCELCEELSDGKFSTPTPPLLSDLSRCPLAKAVERSLQAWASAQSLHAGRVIVRVITAMDSETPAGPALRNFVPDVGNSLKFYKIFALFAQSGEGGRETPVFGAWAYVAKDDGAVSGNRKTAYLSYVEGLPFVAPPPVRRGFVREALTAFLVAFAGAGVERFVWWAAAPLVQDIDYVFADRAAPLKFPENISAREKTKRLNADHKARQGRLIGFYRTLLQSAKDSGKIDSYEEFENTKHKFNKLVDFPFFDSDQVSYIADEVWEDLIKRDRRKKKKSSEEELEVMLVDRLKARITDMYLVQLRAEEDAEELEELCPPVASVVAGTRLGLLAVAGSRGWSFRTKRLGSWSLGNLVGAVRAERRGEPPGPLLDVLVHAVECQAEHCPRRGCRAMFTLLLHFRRCRDLRRHGEPMRVAADCDQCLKLIAFLSFHAESCHRDPCPLPLCRSFRRAAAHHVRGRLSL